MGRWQKTFCTGLKQSTKRAVVAVLLTHQGQLHYLSNGDDLADFAVEAVPWLYGLQIYRSIDEIERDPNNRGCVNVGPAKDKTTTKATVATMDRCAPSNIISLRMITECFQKYQLRSDVYVAIHTEEEKMVSKSERLHDVGDQDQTSKIDAATEPSESMYG